MSTRQLDSPIDLPHGYVRGALLQKILWDLKSYPLAQCSITHWQLTLPRGFIVHMHEGVRRFFLGYMAYCYFEGGSTTTMGPCEVHFCLTGLWQKRGVEYRVVGDKTADPRLLVALQNSQGLAQQLLQLDFQKIRLSIRDSHWWLSIEPFSGTDVALRFPALRRYIRMPKKQREALLSIYLMVHRLMGEYSYG